MNPAEVFARRDEIIRRYNRKEVHELYNADKYAKTASLVHNPWADISQFDSRIGILKTARQGLPDYASDIGAGVGLTGGLAAGYYVNRH